MTKVCHITSVHKPEDVRIFYKECISLANAGYQVSLVQQGESYEKNGVQIIGFGSPASNRLNRVLFTARRAYQTALAIDADIYHFHDPELLPYGLKLKRKGKKVIFDSHEYYRIQMRDKPYLPKWASFCMAKCYSVLEDYALHRIDGVIFPCKIGGKNPFEGKCTHTALVSNTSRLEEFYNHCDEKKQKESRSVIHVGSLTYARGITHLIKAAAKADCSIYLAGTFSSPVYLAEVKALPEYKYVRYLGQLSRPQVRESLQRCQIGIATLLNVGQYDKLDTLPTKVYEYMSMGLPVILSKTPYNQVSTEKYRFGLCVDPENIEEIADTITYLLDHPEEAQQMGENGRRAIKEEFNWDVEEKKLLALYDDILK